MGFAKRLATAAVVVGVAGTGLAFLIGPERVWSRLGPTDLGPVDFAALMRSSTPNDALAATPGALPPGAGAADFALPRYRGASADVLAEVDAAALAGGAERVGSDPTSRRYVTRSPRLRFPDTTVVQAVELADGTVGLRAYARASLGASDFGANANRLRRWLGALPSADL